MSNDVFYFPLNIVEQEFWTFSHPTSLFLLLKHQIQPCFFYSPYRFIEKKKKHTLIFYNKKKKN